MRRLVSVLVMMLVCLASGAAHADPLYDFSFAVGGQTVEFQLPDFAPAQAHMKDNFFGATVPGTVDGTATTFGVSFLVFGPPTVDTISVTPPGTGSYLLGLFGPDPFTLTQTPLPPEDCYAPSELYCIELTTKFVPGTYTYYNLGTLDPGSNVVLTLTEAGGTTVTPEPGALWLLGTGVLGSAGLFRGRRELR